MDNLTRRQLLRAGAAGAVASGLGALTPTTAGAAPTTLGGIHIHGSLVGHLQALVIGRVVYTTVHGPDDDLGGIGIDADPEEIGSMTVRRRDRTQCLFTAHGAVEGDVVRLKGNNLFWQFPPDDTVPIELEANLATGAIRWTEILDGVGPVRFEGTGVVTRI